MISRNHLRLCARNIAACINPKKGECVYIRGNSCFQEIMEEVTLELLRKEALPFVSALSDGYYEKLYRDGTILPETLEKTPRHVLKMHEEMDARITFDFYENPSVKALASRETSAAFIKSFYPLNRIVSGHDDSYPHGKKWLYVGWPTASLARYYGLDAEMFEKLVIGGVSVSHEQLERITLELKQKCDHAKFIRAWDDYGTDFWVNVQGRPCGRDHGLISDENMALGDLGSNLPAGEIGWAPLETTGEGTLFCPVTTNVTSRKIIRNLTLVFKEGKILLDKITADNPADVDDFINTIKSHETRDAESGFIPQVRVRNICELGIGCNPKIKGATGFIICDEKASETVHLALGDNVSFGGTSRSSLHWDFVSAPGINMEVEFEDGKKKMVMEGGKWI